jgi:hypothetical protein
MHKGGITNEQAATAVKLVAEHGGVRPASRAAGIAYGTFRRRYDKALKLGMAVDENWNDGSNRTPATPVIKGRLGIIERKEFLQPAAGKIARHIFTCAQSNTPIHEPLWENLTALATHYDATIHVSTFTYDLASYGPQSVKRGQSKKEGGDKGEPWYDPRVEPYIDDSSAVVAPGLIWCGEMNILPTAARPLSGLESYTGRKSGIFPHVKIAMESIPSGKFEGTKLNFTTGTVTQRNYIQKKAGQKAEFHHGYGALLVEVDSDGGWWCRQLNGDSEGTLYDIANVGPNVTRVMNGEVTHGHRAEAVQWGDIHRDRISDEMMNLLWGWVKFGPANKDNMLDVLRPHHQIFHDTLDFRPRNHHEMKNFHRMYEKFVTGNDDVFAELLRAAYFLKVESYRDWCKGTVVRSNHDAAFEIWLRNAEYKDDLKNAKFFLKAQWAFLDAIDRRDKGFMAFEWACRELEVPADVRFLKRDESFILCPDANGGIECGQHFDLGANGMRGTPMGFAKTGRKLSGGDKHSACIIDGTYVAGVAGDLDHGYNEGMSSWSNSHTVTYPNGKRCIVTVWKGKWRA